MFFFAYETIGKLQSFVLNFSEIAHFPRAVRVTNSCYWYTVLHFIALETRKITALVQRNCITESLHKTQMWKSPRKILSKTTKWWGVGMDITFNMNSTLLRSSFVAYFSNNYFGKSSVAHGYRSDQDVQILASTIRLRAAEETKSRLIPDHLPVYLQK